MADNASTPIVAAEVHERHEAEEALGLDTKTLDPNYIYRWVQNRPQNITRKQSRGGSFVSKEVDKVRPLVDQGGTADDRICNGDTILMKFPRERVEKRRKQIADTTRALLAAPAQQFRQKAERVKVEVTSKEMKA